MFTQWNTVQLLKDKKIPILDKMNGNWGDYSKWNKSGKWKKISRLFYSYMKCK